MPPNSQPFINHALFGVIHTVLVKIWKMILLWWIRIPKYMHVCAICAYFSRRMHHINCLLTGWLLFCVSFGGRKTSKRIGAATFTALAITAVNTFYLVTGILWWFSVVVVVDAATSHRIPRVANVLKFG